MRGRAYPFLNIFVSDPNYGVRLEPDAHTRTRSRKGRITEVETNAEGFRGPQWNDDPPVGPRVLLLGDSQMFGYGVDYRDTFAARLAERIGGEVLDAAVPTWGP